MTGVFTLTDADAEAGDPHATLEVSVLDDGLVMLSICSPYMKREQCVAVNVFDLIFKLLELIRVTK